MTRFALRVDDDLDLVLREPWTDEPLHDLVVANLDRLREWEGWAHHEPSLDGSRAYARAQLLQWVEGQNLPTAIRSGGEIVGSLGARIDPYSSTADLGYWIDHRHEGKGIVTRAVTAMVDHLRVDLGLHRAEIRAAADNTRSRAVADRLGFTHEGTLKSSQVVGDRRLDVALYGLVLQD